MNICDELINQLMYFEFLINKAMHTHGTIPMGYTMTITSGRDGVHSKNSKHYTGDAIDIRTRDMSDVKKVYAMLKENVDDKLFDVVLESDHIHIEYDPK